MKASKLPPVYPKDEELNWLWGAYLCLEDDTEPEKCPEIRGYKTLKSLLQSLKEELTNVAENCFIVYLHDPNDPNNIKIKQGGVGSDLL